MLYHIQSYQGSGTGTFFAPLILGYTWQWDRLSTGVEAGAGPSYLDVGPAMAWNVGIHSGLYLGLVF